MQVSTLGIDLAKNVFQLHGVDNSITKATDQKRIPAISGPVAPLFNWYGSLCISSSLRSSFDAVRPSGQVDAAQLCQTVCEAG